MCSFEVMDEWVVFHEHCLKITEYFMFSVGILVVTNSCMIPIMNIYLCILWWLTILYVHSFSKITEPKFDADLR